MEARIDSKRGDQQRDNVTSADQSLLLSQNVHTPRLPPSKGKASLLQASENLNIAGQDLISSQKD